METLDDGTYEKKIGMSSMSERQAILFLEKGGGDLVESTNPEPKNVVLDYHKYFLFKKKQNELSYPKEKLEERKHLIALSQKEYIHTNKNIYKDRKKNNNFTDDDDYQCNCQPKKFTQSEVNEIIQNQYKGKTEEELFGCGKKCINKLIFAECDENCPCGVSCRNRKFQNQEYADVYPIKTENRGWGLCAGTFLPKDTFIMQYIGEIYSLDSEYGQKKMSEYKNKTCTYLMGLPNNNRHEVIDPTVTGNMARFINHSCDPNCETRKWHVRGELCIGIFTKKDIQEDEELTFNYDFDLCKTPYQKCLCGAPNCRGYLGISTEENRKRLNKQPNCDICKEICRHNESIIDCKLCGKFFHKKCAQKKGQLSSTDYKCPHCLKKNLNASKKLEDANSLKEKLRLDEEPIYDEIYEVGDEDLQKIKKNLGELINIGAGLFWDFQSENAILGTSNKIDLKISGTTKQIESVKDSIRKLKMQKEEGTSEYSVKLNVPKIYIRKIIGHQYRNLDSYKSKFGVQISFDSLLITDDIFSLQEMTAIQIKGKESNVKAVVIDIKKYLYNLKVVSIYLLQEDYLYLRQNICSLKTSVDPADLRLRKYDIKNEREIKHPFYYISSNIKDIVIIGFENEIEKAQKIIKDSIVRQNNLAFNYSLSFLFPIYFKKHLALFIEENDNYIKQNKLRIDSMGPEYLRRHISVTISGKWNNIIEIKNKLWSFLKKFVTKGFPKKHDINEFEQYAYNQEHKLISKSIRTYIIEQNPQIKNWDYISEDIEYLQEKFFDHSSNISGENKILLNQSPDNKDRDSQDVIKNFISTCDKETRVNYLLNMRPGSYSTVFKMNQNDLFDDVIGVLEEAISSYKETKLQQENNSAYSESKNNLSFNEDEYTSKDKEKNNKGFGNNLGLFLEPQKISSSIFNSPSKKLNEDNKISNLTEQLMGSHERDMTNTFKGNGSFERNLEPKKELVAQTYMTNNPLSNLSFDKKNILITNTNNLTSPLTNLNATLPTASFSYNSVIGTKNFISKTNSAPINTYNYKMVSDAKNLNDPSKNFGLRNDNIKPLGYKNNNPYNIRQTSSGYNSYHTNDTNVHNTYSKNDDAGSSGSSFLLRKTNRGGSKSSSKSRTDNREDNYHHKKDLKSSYDYEGRRYKYYDRYDKDYDRFDKKKSLSKKNKGYDDGHRKNSPYNDRPMNYCYEDSGYNGTSTNDYSLKYPDRERERERERDRDIYRNDRPRSSSATPKRQYQNCGYKDYSRYGGGNSDFVPNINLIGDNKGYGKDSYNKDNYKDSNCSYKDYGKDNFKDYNSSRNYTQLNSDKYNSRGYSDNNYSRNYVNDHNKDYSLKDSNNNESGMNCNNNRYSSNNSGYNRPPSKHCYDNSYYRKRIFDDNKYGDKRKSSCFKGTSNFGTGNKYSGGNGGVMRSRMDRSRSRSRSKSRSRSHSRSSLKHSHSNSFHKFNNNFE